MVKFYEISQIEKLGIGDGTVKAAANGTKNYSFGTVVSGVASAPATTGLGLKLFANYEKGDDAYTETTTPGGELITAWDMAAQAGKSIQVSPESITYAPSENYASITEGTTLMAAGSDGNLAIISASSGISTGGVYFKVTKKINFGGAGVLAEVVVK